MKRLIALGVALIVVGFGAVACNPAHGRTPDPGPQAPAPNADPHPSNAVVPVTFKVLFKGHRVMRVQPRVNGHLIEEFIVVAPDDNGGAYDRTFEVPPGASVSVDGIPTANDQGVTNLNGYIACYIMHFTRVLPPFGFVQKQAGSVHCGATAPTS